MIKLYLKAGFYRVTLTHNDIGATQREDGSWTVNSNAFFFNGESYLILRDNLFRYRQNNGQPLDVDCLIIDRGVYPSERLFSEFVIPKRVVLTASVWYGYIEKYKVIMNELGIPYHIIAESGAFIIQ